ncbi:hypothetical protein CJD36_010950 [Flavipsychrobacter stenotrophus]|uniref:Uncharacterized protein n=1 Tax=Flavipsychrobacter stenotrophus TaxID=2077091 RepID=A0A2S7SVC9_9BACT|nr:hypothetical protein [Flavipsychrobacter stenotrophus]PQJ10486.1 hypothetical protein CJD36_010950 [Flavipsychrobacter stenotrophus]
MKINDCLSVVHDLLDHKFIVNGYKKISPKKWTKQNGSVRFEVIIDFWKLGPELHTYLSFSVIDSQVKKIVGKYLNIDDKKNQSLHTLKFFLFDLLNPPLGNSIVFYDKDGLNSIIKNIYDKFIEIDLHILTEKYGKLENILNVLICQTDMYYGKSTFKYLDMITAVVISKIINSPNYDRIVGMISSEWKARKDKFPFSYDVEFYGLILHKIINDFGEKGNVTKLVEE